MASPRPHPTTPPSLRDIALLVGSLGDTAAAPGGSTDPGAGLVVRGVSLDSRAVLPGDLYAGLPGAHAHGAAFAAQAAGSGAVAVLTDERGRELVAEAGVDLPVIVVPDPRGALGAVSARVYGSRDHDLTVLGITGTNGKTTTAYILCAALEALGHRTGLIGTIETRIGDDRVSSIRTTPEATDLHALLAVMGERGIDTCVMEVSSHALRLHRVDGVRYDLALFTNLSQDHLDFHPDMDDYFRAKTELFTPDHAGRGLVCVDDEWGRRLAQETPIPVATLSGGGSVPADWQVHRDPRDPAAFSLKGSHAGAAVDLELRSALPGDFNVVNTAMAAVALLLLGASPAAAGSAILVPPSVPGRMERVSRGGDDPREPLAVVDYAHTPEAIRAALAALRPATTGMLVCVTGAGGDRDRDKRRAMGAAAAAVADLVVVTDDNPRSEDPATIRASVRAGAATGRAEVVEVDRRRAAIVEAVRRAVASGPGATVAVVGKGHETGQEVDGVVHPFDDRVELRRALDEALGGAQ